MVKREVVWAPITDCATARAAASPAVVMAVYTLMSWP